jgi:hypothetical protein
MCRHGHEGDSVNGCASNTAVKEVKLSSMTELVTSFKVSLSGTHVRDVQPVSLITVLWELRQP